MRFGVVDQLGIATRCGWFGRPSYRWERSFLCKIFRSNFHIGTSLDKSEGAPDPGMPELRWPHTASDSAGSPLHHDEEMDLQEGGDGFAGEMDLQEKDGFVVE